MLQFSGTFYKQYVLLLQPMKFFAFIMAIIVFALSVMPCKDAAGISYKNAKIEISQTTNSQNVPFNDACSPFCQCSCCAGFTINHSANYATVPPVNVINPSDSFLPFSIIKVALPVWQPPQLV